MKVALVTGSSSGIGLTIALRLAQEGADVIINGRDLKKIEQARKKIEKEFKEVRTFSGNFDVTDNAQVLNFFENEMEAIRKLNLLVNNAGGLETFGNIFTLTDQDWHRAFDLNCLSAARVCRSAYPWMKNTMSPRSIINIASLVAKQPGVNNPHYLAAKAGIVAVTKQLALKFAPDGITVNSICPSTIQDGEWEQNIKDRAERENISTEEAAKRMELEERAKSPLGLMGISTDVANQVLYLASSEARFLTGNSYDVDGGIRRSI